jgi:hypothetical protein
MKIDKTIIIGLVQGYLGCLLETIHLIVIVHNGGVII